MEQSADGTGEYFPGKMLVDLPFSPFGKQGSRTWIIRER